MADGAGHRTDRRKQGWPNFPARDMQRIKILAMEAGEQIKN
jgi:hypothetical protein